MFRIQTIPVLALLAVLASGGCGGGESVADETELAQPAVREPDGPTAAPGDPESGAPDGSSVDRLEVNIGSGPFAGTHEATGEMGCMMYNGVWQASHETEAASGLSGMLVQAKEVPAPGGDTDKVTLSLVFGQTDDMSGNAGVIDVHGAESGGDGRGTVTRDGPGAVLRIEGVTHYGARISAVLQCADVDFMQ